MACLPLELGEEVVRDGTAKVIHDVSPASRSEESMHDLRTSQMQHASNTFRRRHRRLSRARDLDLNLGTELQHQWQICAEYRLHFNESMQRFMRQSDLSGTKMGSTKSKVKLEDARAQMQTDHLALAEQSAKTKQLERDRAEHMSETQKLESSLDKALLIITALLDHDIALPVNVNDGDSTASCDSASLRSVAQHPLLEAYYDKSGDVAIMHERLDAIYSEYLEDRAQRELLTDQDAKLETSDEDFEVSYTTAINAAKKNILDATDAQQRALRDCLDADINIPLAKLTSEPSVADSGVKNDPLTRAVSGAHSPSRKSYLETTLVNPAPPTNITGHMLPDGTAGPEANVGSYVEGAAIEKWIHGLPQTGTRLNSLNDLDERATPSVRSLADESDAASEDRWHSRPSAAPVADYEHTQHVSTDYRTASPMDAAPQGPPRSNHQPTVTHKRSWNAHKDLEVPETWNAHGSRESLVGEI